MSVSAPSLVLTDSGGGRGWRRIALALAAVALVAVAVSLVLWWLAPAAPPRPPTRTPFGMGLREAAPSAGGLADYLLAVQGNFYRGMQAAVSALRQDGSALWSLVTLGFAYGVFHAAGPGHGKAVIAGYLVANERTLVKGFGLSLAAALVQAVVAILLVAVGALVLQATAAAMSRMTAWVELASFAAVAALGALVTWRKAGKVLGTLALARDPKAPALAESCDHVHLPPPEALDRLTRWRELAGVVLAAGIRPCAGAVIVLVFALSQGLLAAGIAATFAMALGTAITTGLIGALAVFAKGLALKLAGGRGAAGAVAVAGLELLAAAFVLVIGVSLLLGLWRSAGGA
ncbi:MAG TPA: nickel transporter [Microvirga sp.]|jgi:nickel/cobalt exporter